MKRILQIATFLMLLLPGAVLAQGNATVPLSFPDSVLIVFENTRNVDASVIGSGFAVAWNSLGIDQQQAIRKQTSLMKRKKYPLRPHIVTYFGAIVNAANVEKTDASTLSKYLSVAGKVIENYPTAKVLTFLSSANTFFQHHALHFEKSYRLLAGEDAYTFEYREAAPLMSLDDTTQYQSEPVPDGASQMEDTSNEDTWSSDSVAEEPLAPMWMTPAIQPDPMGPVIRFNKITLTFVTQYDSVSLRGTKGIYSLTDRLFVGDGGSFDWTSAGLHPDSVNCTLTGFNFVVTKPEFKADLVKLNYLGKTPGLIPGTFEFKSQPRRDSVASSYPRFKSYQSDLNINGLSGDNVRYRGGFSLTGSKISSASALGEEATIEVYHQGAKKFQAKSTDFTFTDNAISATKARINIQQGNDSIVHSLVRMKYSFDTDTTQHLLLMKDKGDMRNAPYAASFFGVDFTADILRWDLNSDSMNIQTDGGRSIVPMIIESNDFYDIEDYRLLKGTGFRFHPLTLVVSYSLKTGLKEFYTGDLANFSGRSIPEIKSAVEFLAQKGMIVYNPRTDVVRVKDKSIALVKAFRGEADYDNLKIHSVIDSSANASLNFRKGYMTVRGVDEFKVSDSLNVRIKPDSSIITLMQNRDLKFNGTITAGNFEISGKGFTLKYDSFFINLTHIDSINFYVTEKNARGQEIRRKVNNSMVGADSTAAAAGGLGDISKSSGTLFISKANNKSGKVKVPNFPRLDATTGGVIYFDREEVLKGVYDRSMFFVVPPFKLDSLNDADPASINFDGTFVSSGMFPSFKEKLHTQPDKSLGFVHTIPAAGYQLYKVDGNMKGILSMDNRGLRGIGTIEFLAAKLSSQDFIFYPDSVITRGNRGTISEMQFGSIKFPQASLPDFDMKWYPKEDRMRLKNLKAPFNFYDSTAQMQGSITISKTGVGGAGKLETRGTELISRDMKFSGEDFSARHARFKVKSDDPNKNLLAGNDIRLRFNLRENYADISPEVEGVAAIEFPYAQFKTSITKAHWDLNAHKITMSKDPNVPIENSYFYTTRKDLDSLSFNAEKAEYDLNSQQLKVSGIPFITVADARITPENNEVLVLENAKIGTLKNTTIVLDTLNGYHRLTEGVLDVISRNEFSGYATYQYVNFLNDTFAIKMTDFHLEAISETEQSRRSQRKNSVAQMQTVAKGSVEENESLVLGAGMFYKGDMVMYATRPALQLAGYVKLDIRKIKDYNTWIRYEQTGDETEVLIPFDQALTEDGKKPSAGLHFNAADNELYITFLNDKKTDDDDSFFEPSGMLFYDKEAKEYKIEDREKAAGNKLSGKVFGYNDETMQVRFEGPVKFFNGTKGFNINATTIGSGNLETNDIKMNSMVVVDGTLPATALDLMARNLADVIKNEGAEEGLGDQTELLYKIADIVGEKLAKDYEQRSLQGYVSLATLPPLIKPLVVSNVNLKWSPAQKGFYSEGLIGISNIMKNDVNGGFEGFMEIRKTEDGAPVFHLFFKASPESWYYFGFEDNRLLIHSSNSDFNTAIAKKSNAGKAKVGEVAFIPGSDDETLAFINKFRKAYYGIDVPYSLSDGSQAIPKKAEEPAKKKEEDDGF
ncbi:MAG TPA: hypothetical protein VGD40_11645 [Chryseosolibacter sp.]